MGFFDFLNEHGFTDDDGDFVSSEKLDEAISNNYVKETSYGTVYDPDTGKEYNRDTGRQH